MAYRPYPNRDRALRQVERARTAVTFARIEAAQRAASRVREDAEQRIRAHANLVADQLTAELLPPDMRAAGMRFVYDDAPI